MSLDLIAGARVRVAGNVAGTVVTALMDTNGLIVILSEGAYILVSADLCVVEHTVHTFGPITFVETGEYRSLRVGEWFLDSEDYPTFNSNLDRRYNQPYRIIRPVSSAGA